MKFGFAIVGLWVLVSAGAFWHFELRYALPAGSPSTVQRAAPGESLQTDKGPITLGSNQPITLLDFTSADCACSQAIRGTIAELYRKYAPKHIRFVTVQEGKEDVTTDVPRVRDPAGNIARSFGVRATPSAVIIDSSGAVIYAGAYNRGRFCDDSQTAFVELALKAIASGRRPEIQRTPFFGCAIPNG
jgi:hypothetical protein